MFVRNLVCRLFHRKLTLPLVGVGLLILFTFISYSVYNRKTGISIDYDKVEVLRNASPTVKQQAMVAFGRNNITEWPYIRDKMKGSVTRQSNLTIVTAYFDIGKFGKGTPHTVWNVETYLKFAQSFRFLMNPVVIYTDSRNFFELMQTLRANLTNITKMFLIDKKSSWAFQRKDMITDIFAIKGYPKHYPNTVVPEYSCAQHAKYDVVARAAKENYFHTDYFAWLDVGLFRAEAKSHKYFILQTPPGFNSSRIAVNEVYNPNMNTAISDIFRNNFVWICGCIFVGQRKIILSYTEQYKRAVDYFLSQKLMNTDQQVLYAMYSVSARREIKPDIDVQLYRSNNSGYDPWFYLGYTMRQFI